MFRRIIVVVMLCSICSAYSEVTDPTQPQWPGGISPLQKADKAQTNTDIKPTEAPKPDTVFQLQAVSIIGDKQRAKINGQWLEPGQTIESAELTHVTSVAAVIVYKGKRKTLNLFQQQAEIIVLDSVQESSK